MRQLKLKLKLVLPVWEFDLAKKIIINCQSQKPYRIQS